MHTRRISSFFVGAWLAGSLFMAFIALQNFRSPSLVTGTSLPPVTKLIETLGADQMGELLRHFAAEQTRHYMYLWAELQIVIGAALGLCLFLATQRRIFPMALCGVMLVIVLFELRLVPELTYLGRETDFPPGSTSVSALQRLWALQQVFGGVEIVKVIAGGILASYLFVFRTSRRGRKEINPINHADHSHVNR